MKRSAVTLLWNQESGNGLMRWLRLPLKKNPGFACSTCRRNEGWYEDFNVLISKIEFGWSNTTLLNKVVIARSEATKQSQKNEVAALLGLRWLVKKQSAPVLVRADLEDQFIGSSPA